MGTAPPSLDGQSDPAGGTDALHRKCFISARLRSIPPMVPAMETTMPTVPGALLADCETPMIPRIKPAKPNKGGHSKKATQPKIIERVEHVCPAFPEPRALRVPRRRVSSKTSPQKRHLRALATIISPHIGHGRRPSSSSPPCSASGVKPPAEGGGKGAASFGKPSSGTRLL